MKNLELYTVDSLENFELVTINGGGDPIEGSYELGNRIGKAIRFIALAEVYIVVKAWDILTN